MLRPLSYAEPLTRITEIAPELSIRKKNVPKLRIFSPHITPPINLQPYIRNYSFHLHLKAARHGETGQSKEKSISFRSFSSLCDSETPWILIPFLFPR